MDNRTQFLLLAFVSLGSLAWGARDLLRRRGEESFSYRVQSWAQVAAGLIGIGFLLSYLLAR